MYSYFYVCVPFCIFCFIDIYIYIYIYIRSLNSDTLHNATYKGQASFTIIVQYPFPLSISVNTSLIVAALPKHVAPLREDKLFPVNTQLCSFVRIAYWVPTTQWEGCTTHQFFPFIFLIYCSNYISLFLLSIRKNTIYKLMWWFYKLQANVMILQSTLRYHVLLWRGRLFIKRGHIRCLVIRKASIFLAS